MRPTAERLAALGLLEARQLDELLLDGLLGLEDDLLLGRVGLRALGLELVLLELDRLLVDRDDLRQLVARGARAATSLPSLARWITRAELSTPSSARLYTSKSLACFRFAWAVVQPLSLRMTLRRSIWPCSFFSTSSTTFFCCALLPRTSSFSFSYWRASRSTAISLSSSPQLADEPSTRSPVLARSIARAAFSLPSSARL